MAPKRKAIEELSVNPATVKSRNRNAKLADDEYLAEVEKAKASDQAAVTYHKRKLLKTQVFLDATLVEQERLIRESKENVLHRRAQLGINWHAKARELGLGEDGGLFARVDDGNPVWMDIEFDEEEEHQFEKMWRSDEQANNEGHVGHELAKGAKTQASKTLRKRGTDYQIKEFMKWQDMWRTSQATLEMKTRYLTANDKLPIWNGRIVPPGLLFDEEEKAIWRNCVTWAWPGTDWIDLPGPASWWPDDLDEIDKAGFFIPDVHGPQNRYKEAWDLVQQEFGQNVPLNYQLVLPFNPPTYKKLILGKDSLITRNKIQDYWFGRLGKAKVAKNVGLFRK